MSELTKRVLFAVVAIPVVLALVWLGRLPFALLLAVAAGLGAWEYARMVRAAGGAPLDTAMVVLATALPIVVHLAATGAWVPSLPAVALLVPLLLTVALFGQGVAAGGVTGIGATLFGAWYTGGMLAFAYALRHSRFTIGDLAGTLLVALPLILTWVNDAGAYFVGRAVGGRKLMPSVSPGKTIAGAVGGLLTTIAVTALYVRFVLGPNTSLGMTLGAMILFGTVISVVAQVGDLAESMLKRQAGVKDSSALIPGHGGVLDRVDSLLFVFPVAFILFDVMLTVRA
jgi:phosphatidate cytidylyltransferase